METTVTVKNPHGLHARPAAAFVKEAARFQAQVQVFNASNGKGPAPARSILAILALGVRQGHTVRLVADGAQAGEVLAALADLLERQSEDSQVTRVEPAKESPA